MKNYKIIPLLFISSIFLLGAFKEKEKATGINRIDWKQYSDRSDTLPNICAVLPAQEIEALQIFKNPLTKSYPDPDSLEDFSVCHYEFYKPNDYPSLQVSLSKHSTKEEAGNVFHQHTLDQHDICGVDPERISQLGDSASFDINTNEPNKCDECVLIVSQGQYTIELYFKGQMEEVPRERKKAIGINIVKMMFDRIPGLAPHFIRKKGN